MSDQNDKCDENHLKCNYSDDENWRKIDYDENGGFNFSMMIALTAESHRALLRSNIYGLPCLNHQIIEYSKMEKNIQSLNTG